MEEQQHCSVHPTELVFKYCTQCKIGICSVCEQVEHDGHLSQSLSGMTYDRLRGVKHLSTTTETVLQQLSCLLDDVGPSEAALHEYIGTELASLQTELEKKRANLHTEVNSRSSQMRALLENEIAVCEDELNSIEEGQMVLDAMAQREGTVGTPLGQLIHGHMPYDEFWSQVARPLHKPEKMLHMLGLQLPMQSLEEMCDLMTWTALSMESAPQIFPVDGTKLLTRQKKGTDGG